MPTAGEIYKTYSEKKAQIDEKTAVKKQEIESLMADLEALPGELAGQSEEYINRQKEKLMKKIERKTKKMQDWVEEQMKVVEDWLNVQKEKVQSGIDKMIDLQKQVTEEAGKMQIKATAAIMTGQKIEEGQEQESQEQETQTIPIPKPKFGDDEYRYCYKNSKGDLINGLGSEVAKRKHYDRSKVYEDDEESLKKSNIYRQKYKWSFQWEHRLVENKQVDGIWQKVPTTDQKGYSSADEPLESLDEVFQFIDSKWMTEKETARREFKNSAERTKYKKVKSQSRGASSSEMWVLEISRSI